MGTFQQAQAGDAPPAKGGGSYRAANPADPRLSKDYAVEKAKAKDRDAVRKRFRKDGLLGYGGEGVGALLESFMPLPVGDEMRGGMFAAGNAVANVGRRLVGAPTVDSEAIYLANKDAENEYVGDLKAKHKVAATAGPVLAALAGGSPALSGARAAAPAAMSLAEKAGMFAKNATKAAGVGGIFSSLYGAAQGEGAGDRMERAADAFVPGAVAGGLTYGAVTAASPLVRKIPGVVSDIAGMVTRRPPPPGVRPTATPAQAEQAALAVDRLAEQAGVTPESAARLAAERFQGRPVTAAELIGREGVTQLAATARRGGSTPDELEGLLRARAAGTGRRILNDFEADLGVSPEAAYGSIDDIVERGQAEARPLYEAALGGDRPVWNNELHGLAQRPVVRDAIKAARDSLRNAGRNPEALGLADVEVPGAWDNFIPPDTAAPAAAAPVRGPMKAPSRGPSLLKYIADGRGISDAADELSAMDAGQWHRGKAFQRQLTGQGGTLDDWALRAWEQGYFPEFQTRPTERQLLDAMREELRGRPRFAREADPMAQQRFEARNAADEADYYGGDAADLPTPEQYVGRPAPQTETAYQAEPTAEAWDHVKQALGNLVERDPLTGKVIYSGEKGLRNRNLDRASRDLTEALAGTDTRPGAIPGYREALDRSGDYLTVQSAFNRAKGMLTQKSVRDFGKVWASAKTDAERRAMQSALANDVLNLAEAGHLRGGKFSVPGIQQKLELAFGRRRAAAFVQKMEAEAEIARTGQRMMPGAGSPTMELTEAANDQGGALADAARIASKAGRGNAGGALADLVTNMYRWTTSYARTSGMPVEVRDEFGRILSMSADDFVQFLQTRQPTAVRAPDGRWIASGIVGGEIGAQVAGANR